MVISAHGFASPLSTYSSTVSYTVCETNHLCKIDESEKEAREIYLKSINKSLSFHLLPSLIYGRKYKKKTQKVFDFQVFSVFTKEKKSIFFYFYFYFFFDLKCLLNFAVYLTSHLYDSAVEGVLGFFVVVLLSFLL